VAKVGKRDTLEGFTDSGEGAIVGVVSSYGSFIVTYVCR
jgi:hypothetical protein